MKKKGGPYTIGEKEKRREQVSKLHYEYGHSARKISRMLKINRGTINRNIMFLQNIVADEYRQLDPSVYLMDEVFRLKIQRTRSRKRLDKVKSFQEEMKIEKMIYDISSKIGSLQIGFSESRRQLFETSTRRINEFFRKENNPKKAVSINDFYVVSKKANEKMQKIFYDDKRI